MSKSAKKPDPKSDTKPVSKTRELIENAGVISPEFMEEFSLAIGADVTSRAIDGTQARRLTYLLNNAIASDSMPTTAQLFAAMDGTPVPAATPTPTPKPDAKPRTNAVVPATTEIIDDGFRYSALDAQTRSLVQHRTSEIRGLMRRAAQGIVDIGLKLIEVKERLGHGKFLPWLEAEFGWSDQTARRFVHVAERFGQNQQIVGFEPSALYLLAAPSTPDAAREEALERAEQGEPITHAKAREIVGTHRPTPSAPNYDDDFDADPEPMIIHDPESAPYQLPAGAQLEDDPYDDLPPDLPPEPVRMPRPPRNVQIAQQVAEVDQPVEAADELGGEKPKPPEQPTGEDEEVLDEFGQKIPKRFTVAFKMGEPMREMVKTLRRMEREVTALCHDDSKGAHELRAGCQLREKDGKQTFRLEHLHTALKRVEFAIPYTVCPHCHNDHPGRADTDCRTCYGSGVVSKVAFERVAQDLQLAVKHRDELARRGIE